jgi:hypothetical protein
MNLAFRNFLRTNELYNCGFEVVSKKFDSFSPLTWENFYSSIEGVQGANNEKSYINKYSASGLEKHLLNHLSSAADLNMRGDNVGRDMIIKNYTYDLAVAHLFEIKLRSDLFDESYSEELILSGHLPNNGITDTHPELFKLSKKDYLSEVSELYNLHSMNELRVRGKILGQDFEISNCPEICDKSGEDILYSMPTSKIEGVEGNFGLSVPIYCSPIFILPNKLNYFKDTTNARQVFPLACVPEFCDIMDRKVKVYREKLTGEVSPSSQAVRDAVLDVKNFARYLL